MEYSVLIHKAGEGGFWSEVPALPGCLSQGETVEETMTNTKEAAELIISVLMEEGREIPVEDEFTVHRIHIRGDWTKERKYRLSNNLDKVCEEIQNMQKKE